jgi:hypothetical protein
MGREARVLVAAGTLTVNSSPITGIAITVDGTSYTTNTSAITLSVGAHAVVVPATFTSGSVLYGFLHWEDNSTSLSRSVSVTTGATTITATYGVVMHNLVVSSTPVTGIPIIVDGAAYTTNTPSISLQEGTHTVIVPARFTLGTTIYGFASWEDGITSTTRSVVLNADKSIIATYALVNHNLTVTSTPITGIPITVDGTSRTTNSVAISLTEGTHSIVVPQRVTTGTSVYQFQQWEDASTSLTRSVFLTADKTVTTTYFLVTHTITVSNTPITGIPITVAGTAYVTNTAAIALPEGTHTVIVPAAFVSKPTTYAFQKWEDNSTSLRRSVSLTANMTLTATYVAVHPTLTLASSPTGLGTLTASRSPPYDLNETVVLSATAVDPVNYTFLKWTKEDGSALATTASASIVMDTNHTLTAVFGSITHPKLTLQVNPAGSGTIATEQPPYAVGQVVHVTASPTGAYQLTGWSLDGGTYDGTAASVTVTMDVSHVLTAQFTLKTHSLKVNSVPTGVSITIDRASHTTNTSALTLQEGTHAIIVPTSFVAASGTYNFQHWENNSTSTTRNVSLTADTTVTATYQLATHNLTMNSTPITGVAITVNGTPYATNTAVSLPVGSYTASARTSVSSGASTYTFQHWEDDSTSVSRTINLTTDTTITATYVPTIPTHGLARARETRHVGVYAQHLVPYIFLVFGLASLFSSAFYSSYVLAFVGLSLTFWGALFLYVKSTKYVKLDLLNAASSSGPYNIERILATTKTGLRGIYLPPKNLQDHTSSLVFIPTEPNWPLPTSAETNPQKLESKNAMGILLTPPGLALSKLFEKELKKPFTETSLEDLQTQLPELFDELQITKHLTIQPQDNLITVTITNHVFEDLCKETAKLELTHRTVGCPLSSALACAFAKATGKPIIIAREETGPDETTTIKYKVLED